MYFAKTFILFHADFVHIDETIENHLDSKMQCFIQQYSQHIIQKTGKTVSFFFFVSSL